MYTEKELNLLRQTDNADQLSDQELNGTIARVKAAKTRAQTLLRKQVKALQERENNRGADKGKNLRSEAKIEAFSFAQEKLNQEKLKRESERAQAQKALSDSTKTKKSVNRSKRKAASRQNAPSLSNKLPGVKGKGTRGKIIGTHQRSANNRRSGRLRG